MVSKTAEIRLPTSGIHTVDTPEPALRERRRRIRVHVHWPVRFFLEGTEETVDTVTQDLSSDGFYCQASTVFVPGEIRACTLGVPTHHRNGGGIRPVLCKVRVIRVEALGADGLYGVGCRIEDYHFIS
jgi:hypothetical protein